MKSRHITELDGIRGFAALFVAFHHLVATSIKPGDWSRPVQWIYEVSVFGSYGVDIFFVLSGFLITSLLILDRNAPSYYSNFYWKRALRILPLYCVVLAVVYCTVSNSGPYVLISLLFVANFANVLHVESHGPFWTLAIEEQFYLVWPQLVKRISVTSLYYVALLLCLLIPALRVGAALVHHHNFWLTPFRCDGLAMGALLACQWHLGNMSKNAANAAIWWKRIGRWAGLAGLVLGALCIAGLRISSLTLLSEAIFLSGISLLTYGVIAYALSHPESQALWIFRSRAMTFLGDISYCFYLSHTYILELYDHCFGSLQAGNILALAMRAFSVIALTVLVSIAARHLIERPAQSLRRYVLR